MRQAVNIGHGSKESFKIHLILLLAIKACSPSACVVIYIDICFITCSTEKSCLNVSPLLLLIRCKKCARMCFHSKTLLLNTTSYLSNPIRSICLIVCVDIGEPSGGICRSWVCMSKVTLLLLFYSTPPPHLVSISLGGNVWSLTCSFIIVTLYFMFLWLPKLILNLSNLWVPSLLCCYVPPGNTHKKLRLTAVKCFFLWQTWCWALHRFYLIYFSNNTINLVLNNFHITDWKMIFQKLKEVTQNNTPKRDKNEI